MRTDTAIPHDLWARLDLSSEIADARVQLERSRVLLIGCGALGSEIALKLAGCAVKQLTLVDGDTVSLANIPHSSIFLPRHVGAKKVHVVSEFLTKKFPDCQVVAIPLFIQQYKEIDLYTSHDIIVCAPDNNQTRLWINHYAVAYQKPTLFLGVSGPRDAWGGYTFFYTPGASPCFLCLSSGGEADGLLSYDHEPDTLDMETARRKCGGENVAVPMLAPVVGMVANYAALQVVKYLIGAGPLPVHSAFYLKQPKVYITPGDWGGSVGIDLYLQTLQLKPSPGCAVCNVLEEYDLPQSSLDPAVQVKHEATEMVYGQDRRE
jgi:molybdopterin/thiamine biosynthesis adenylyltransferase